MDGRNRLVDDMAATNEHIARQFEEMADLLEIEGANPFRVRAYRNAARTLRALRTDIADLVADGDDLTRLPGIGKDLAGKIIEIVDTGHAAALDRLHHEFPQGLADLLQIPGLGPKRVKLLYDTLHITSLGELEDAARNGRISSISGFGDKTEQSIIKAIASRRAAGRRFLRDDARPRAEALLVRLGKLPGVEKAVVAGSYRRGRETVGDLDIVVASDHGERVMEAFTTHRDVSEVVSKGSTRATVYLDNDLQVDLRVVEPKAFGAALHYFTGSKAHNIAVRRLGQQRGLKINEYGVFEKDHRTAGDTEESVYASIGMPFIPPELREDQGELDAAREGALPKLVERRDLAGDLHVHTDASDGSAAISDMANAAREAGLRYIAVTDHSRRLRIANGLDEKRLRKQIEEIDEINDSLTGFTVLKGVEVDILEDGSLDLSDEVLSELDLVVGAIHSAFGLSRRKQTRRILRAMDSKYFSILAHPGGRLIGKREPSDFDMNEVIEGAAARGCFLELNSQPDRLDLTDTGCRLASEHGVLVAVSSDSHSVEGFSHLAGGILQARRGWLKKEDVLNSRPLAKLRHLLARTMG